MFKILPISVDKTLDFTAVIFLSIFVFFPPLNTYLQLHFIKYNFLIFSPSLCSKCTSLVNIFVLISYLINVKVLKIAGCRGWNRNLLQFVPPQKGQSVVIWWRITGSVIDSMSLYSGPGNLSHDTVSVRLKS